MMILARLAIAIGCLLAAQPALASQCFISEYSRLGITIAGVQPPISSEPSITDQAVDFSGGATQSAAFSATTYFIRVWCDAQASLAFGSNPTATTANMPIGAGAPEYFGVNPAQKMSAVSHP